MTIGTFILIQAIILLVFGGFFVVRNLLRKNEAFETENTLLKNRFNELFNVIKDSNQRLQELDQNKIFSSDDEIGWFFSQVKEMQIHMEDFIESQNSKLL